MEPEPAKGFPSNEHSSWFAIYSWCICLE